MKKLFLFIFATMLVGQAWAYDFKSGDLYYYILSDSTVAVTSDYDNHYDGIDTITIPEKVNYNEVEYTVASIGDYAFQDCNNLKSIFIPNSVTSIGYRAFFRSYLSKVEFASIESICRMNFDDDYPFNYSYHLYIGGEEITDLVIPDYVTSINSSAFAGGKYLTSVTFPNSVISIGSYAFRSCDNIKMITIPDSVISIGNYAFSNATIVIYSGKALGRPWGAKNAYATIDENGFMYSDTEKTQLAAYVGNMDSITIPNTITNICDNAFYNCNSLSSVCIPNSVTTIGASAFYNCSSLSSVSIPNSVTTIGASAFYGCSRLTSVVIPNSVTVIGQSAFNNSKTTFYCEASREPDGWVNVYVNYEGRKRWNDNLGNVLWGRIGLLTVDDFVYSIYSDTSKHQIEVNRYTGNSTSVKIPSKVTVDGVEYTVISIGNNVFKNCGNLTSITIPNTITIVGTGAFDGCDKLDYNIYDNGCYLGNDENPYLVLLMAKRQNITECKINSNCKIIYDNAFNGCSGLATISIPESVTSIGILAFNGCVGLEKAEFASIENLCNIKMVGKSEFGDSYGNVEYNYSSNPLFYAHHLYVGGSEITDLVIPKFVSIIGNGAFAGCSALKRVIFHESVTDIGECAFLGCNNISSITIPKSTKRIDNYAFYNCDKISTAIIPISVIKIGKNAFNGENTTFYCEANIKPTNWYSKTEGDMAHYYYCYWNGDKGTVNWNIKAQLLDDYVYKILSDSEPRQVEIYKYLGDGDATIPSDATFDGIKYQIVSIDNVAFGYKTNNYYYDESGEQHFVYNYTKLYRVVCSSTTPIKLEEDPFPNNDTIYVPASSVDAYQSAFIWKRKEILPITLYEVTSNANTEGCEVNGMGTYAPGSIVTLTATPAEGYHFVKWSDGNTENPRNVIVVEDLALTAVFEANENQGGNEQGGNEQGGENQGGNENNPGTAVAETTANAINIHTSGNTIVVENATEEIRVYDAMGRLVGKNAGRNATITVKGTGVYIVKTGGVVKRVVVD